ncbi:hypothetical protein COCMIDRAFT_93268 [Bipolaris oryzae ATCC 44560]|uniref:Oxo-4-hydroxy-4-carboxy-5-ureidoimidazoline decarboxylase domain-containing protein n=1 Tax=Bipolaris oryzae ATCC 44560 TaxID=930090 RepID=W6ZRD3_COCMI|nr:uncharacterized protein COCMIDRAFT_93268 [Bipolaris oryzae ATCC 44560]EUC46241.1 hypothetical protein COCMIDRAFT_93268 [Bipolaris oryzae ATCC 44560]
MTPSLPPISSLPHSPDTTLTTTLDLLFEPSPALHTLTLPVLRSTTFPSYAVLITAIGTQLRALTASSTPEDAERLQEILCAHPRLGAKKVESEQSRAEQANLAGEGEELKDLNEEYEVTFPGLRYVVFVNGRSRPEIMNNMRHRIARADIAAERQEAIQAMCDIALDRAGKLQQQ